MSDIAKKVKNPEIFPKYIVLKMENRVDLQGLIDDLTDLKNRKDGDFFKWKNIAKILISNDIQTTFLHCVYCGELIYDNRAVKRVDNDYHNGYGHLGCIMNNGGRVTLHIDEMRGGK